MRRFSLTRSEPGENDRDSTANRLVGSKVAAFTGKKQRGFPCFLKRGHMCAVQVNLRRAPVALSLDFEQLRLSFQKPASPRFCKTVPPISDHFPGRLPNGFENRHSFFAGVRFRPAAL